MKLHTKIMILLTLVIIILISAIVSIEVISLKNKKLLVDENQKNSQQVINQILKVKADILYNVSYDYSCWDDMVKFTKDFDSLWAQQNIENATVLYKLSFFSVYDKNKKLVYIATDSFDNENNVVFDTNLIAECFSAKTNCHFFKYFGNKLYEIYGSIIVPSTDYNYRLTAPLGYLFVSKQINTKYLEDLSNSTGFKTILKKSNEKIVKSDDKIINTRALKDEENNEIAYLEFISESLIYIETRTLLFAFIVIICISVISLIVLFLIIRRIVTVPISEITESLDSEDIDYVSKYLAKQDEFGKISKMIDTSLKQKNELLLKNNILEEQAVEIINKNEILLLHKEKLDEQTDVLRKINNEIKSQKETVEVAFHEIKSSISYAKTIQHALLPSQNYLNEILKENFVFYKPKDIVSGDFYWLKQFENSIVIAVADCTGHGVPGAFMSMLGISFLNSIVSEKNYHETDEILNNLRILIKKSLHQENISDDLDDGMDISILSIDNNTCTLNFSGALSSMYIIRNKLLPKISQHNLFIDSNLENNLFQIDGDEMPIGVYYKENSFSKTTIKLFENDLIYTCSDGYYDQFGGLKFERFSSKKFRDLLLEISLLPMNNQHNYLETTFNQWINGRKQVDDILVFGMKI